MGWRVGIGSFLSGAVLCVSNEGAPQGNVHPWGAEYYEVTRPAWCCFPGVEVLQHAPPSVFKRGTDFTGPSRCFVLAGTDCLSKLCSRAQILFKILKLLVFTMWSVVCAHARMRARAAVLFSCTVCCAPDCRLRGVRTQVLWLHFSFYWDNEGSLERVPHL